MKSLPWELGPWWGPPRAASHRQPKKLAQTRLESTWPPSAPPRGSAAWAGLCPASHESAGKRTRYSTRKRNPHLKATLVTAAMCGAGPGPVTSP